MKRAILLLAALVGTTSCYSRRCSDDITVFWRFPNANGTANSLNCSQAGVVSVQVTVDSFVEPLFACTGVDVAQGVTLLSFDEGNHTFQIDGLDASGNIIYSTGAFTFAPGGCRLNELDADLAAVTGNLTILPTFSGTAFTSCAQAGVDNFFVELLDASNTPVTAFDQVYLPCVNTSRGPSFTVAGIPFGQTYTFRTLDSTVTSNGQQVVVDQACGVPVGFTVANQAFVIDLPPDTGNACP